MKKKNYFFLILLFIGITTAANAQIIWAQIGLDIDGEAASDFSGNSVSLSSDGSTVAIGAPYNVGNGLEAGHVRIYQNIAGTWTQIGADIDAEASGNWFGMSVSSSSDGSVVAIGAPLNSGNGYYSGHVRIYQNNAGTWTQIGADIDGEADDFSGNSVSLSSDGSTVAIGATGNDGNGTDAGTVRIYQNIAGTWTQIGADINGEAEDDNSGSSVSLSSDGSTVAIGAPYNDGNGTNAGNVRIYHNNAGTWTQIGVSIYGEFVSDHFGKSVSLNSDGSTVAIGAPDNNGNDTDAGHVRIYHNNAGTWTQIGADIDGEAVSDNSGISVSLSSDGSLVAIGALFNDGNGSNAGHVRIYQNNAGTWTQMGADIDGEAESDFSGNSVSLSSDGSVAAIGAYGNDENGLSSGHVRVYNLLILPSITSQPANQTDICSGAEAVFSVTGENIDTYQWQVSTDGGDTWSDLSDNATYTGVTTNTLTVTSDIGLNNYKYHCYVINNNGNTTSDAAILTFETEDPVITSTHNDRNIDADASCEASLPDYTSEVTATDNCTASNSLTVTQSPTAETTISGATNQVTLTVTDGAGNNVETNFNVAVVDNTDPTIECVSNQAVNADDATNTYIVKSTEFDPVNANDNCNYTFLNNINSLETLAGVILPLGNTIISWIITDEADNSVFCNFLVTVNAYVGIETLHQNGISIYPNPTNGIINFEFAENYIQQIKVTDITGKTIIEKTAKQQNEIIDLSGFESGIYIISIQTDKEVLTIRIVKR